MTEVDRIIERMERGEHGAAEELLPLVYDELRKLAAARLANEKPGQTLQATALVHEAYMRLSAGDIGRQWDSRGHFFSAAAEAMRRILIENARRKRRLKRGGGCRRVDIDRVDLVSHMNSDELVRLDDAINRLTTEDPAAAQIVTLRYFSGLSIQEAASAMGIGTSTAYRHWAFARAWLHKELLQEQD